MRKEEGKGGREARGGDPGWEGQMGGREAGKRPPGRGRDPSWETKQHQKAVWDFFFFFLATDLIS